MKDQYSKTNKKSINTQKALQQDGAQKQTENKDRDNISDINSYDAGLEYYKGVSGVNLSNLEKGQKQYSKTNKEPINVRKVLKQDVTRKQSKDHDNISDVNACDAGLEYYKGVSGVNLSNLEKGQKTQTKKTIQNTEHRNIRVTKQQTKTTINKGRVL